MKRYSLLFLLSLLIIFLSVGCSASYNIAVNAYSSSRQKLLIPEESSVYVVTDSNAPNPILDKEIAAKIQTLLTKNGYSTAADQADYYLLFNYGMTPDRNNTGTMPYYRSGLYYGYPFHYGFRYSYAPYAPYYTAVYNRWLVLKLIDGKAYRASPKAEPLWISEVSSTGPSSDLRKLINYMLLAAFEHFGQDTGKRIHELIPYNDERLNLFTQ
ncbi:MAG: DUF4136 domain-containing protein [Sedimentisphaerales bacterium]|nr:DUF4136 domain-containing protein [Sedimentisphaerales bacterium]